ncbi:M1 family metallopeptidase [Stigmatella aurantiaca]|uniref:Aminopeptidase n=1 Tax=Stigmatella aurantiaca (strain DW4/3-1) TaxID=378806 RepID=E3FUZ0_STIAD|nr:M1 family metallopeptidase [Stigmatella aurantiaca]ADO68428.1 Peptidase, M1 (Aminopeptidase N) family [Stigmatella aurantiaca DW4/3-1]
MSPPRPFAVLLLGLLVACAGSQPAPQGAQAPTPPRPAPVVSPTPPPALRLPGTVRPTGYTAELTVDPQSPTFQGVVDIALDIAEPTLVIWLHGKDMTVKEAVLTQAGQALAAVPTVAPGSFLGFTLASPAAPGPASLRITYEAAASVREVEGAFRTQESGDWYVFTQFEPLGARRVFPCFDEPGFKVPWQLSFHVPAGNVAVTNTPLLGEEARADGGRTFRFARTQPLPSYLIAFGVGPLEFVQAEPSGSKKVPTRIITPRGRAAEAAYAARVTPQILAQLEAYFGMPYPFEKLDTLAVPLLMGAMEHPGLVTFNSELLLAAGAEDSVEHQRRFAEVQVHELAHQWFGNLVTLAWWDDLWLNESFASWMTPRIVEGWQPTWDAMVDRVQSRSEALEADSLVSARRIRQPIENEGDIRTAFDGITYGKGSAVLAMTEEWLGRDVFQRGIQRYLRAHAGGNATVDDFLAALSAEAGQDVAKVLGTFLEQGGAPLVTAALDCSGKVPKVALTQRRYLPVGSSGEGARLWRVPLCVRYGVKAATGRSCTVLETERAELPLPEAKACPDWFFPNAEGAGYVRTQLTGADWRRLLTVAGTRLSRAERVTLLGDVRALAKAGQLPAGDALALAARFAEDPDRQVFLASTVLLSVVDRRMLSEERRADYARFLRETYGPRARKLGFVPRAGESEDTRLLRPELLFLAGVMGEDPKLLSEARKLTDQWLKDRSAVAPELVEGVLGITASHSGRELAPQLRAALKAEKERKVRRYLLGALGDIQDPEVMRQQLPLVLDPSEDPRETVWMMFSASQEPRTSGVVYNFMKENYDALAARMPEEFASYMVMLGGGFCDVEHRKDVESFFSERVARTASGSRRLAQTLERIDLCIALKQAQGASIDAYLTKGPVKMPPPAQ